MQNLLFHPQVKMFQIEGITMVGDLLSGSCISLDQEGETFTRYFLGDYSGQVKLDELTTTQAQLLESFIDCSFFQKEEASLKNAYVHITDRYTLDTLDALSVLECLESHLYATDDNHSADMDLGEIWNALFQLKDLGVQRFVFSGGDPFVRHDFDLICKMAKDELQIPHVSVITTGTLPRVHYEKCLPFIDSITVLIDGYSNPLNSSSSRTTMPPVLSSINWLKTRIKVDLMANLNLQTIHSMKDYQALAHTTGLNLSYRILADSLEEESFKRHLFSGNVFEKTRSQSIGPEVISISAHGAIYPCLRMHDETLSIGNILHTPIELAIQSLRSSY